MTSELLDGLDRVLARFVAFPSDHARHATAAWALHCWTLGAFDSTPRLAALSPEKGSGKTRLLEVLELVVPNAKHTVNMSSAVLFRLVGGDERVTLLMDEADTYLGWKVAREHEDIRGLVNAGHRRGATAYRMKMEGGAQVVEFPAFAAVALAGIGDLPDTIIDRSVVIAMKRRAPSEPVEQFRRRLVEPQVAHLVDAIEVWAETAVDLLVEVIDTMVMPDGIEDRPADVWEPLIAIGDLAGEPWADRLRTAATELNQLREARDPSLGVQLLGDVRRVFDRLGVDRITSADLATALAAIEGAPWADLRGVPIDKQGIAKRLKPYGVRPEVHRFGDTTARGYRREDLHDAWTRYLPRNPVTGVTDETEPARDGPAVTSVTAVTGFRGRYRPNDHDEPASVPADNGADDRLVDAPVCHGCGGSAERTSATGTHWCRSCWDTAAGGAA